MKKKENNKKAVVISAHPYDKSFNIAMKNTAVEALKEVGVEVIDINLAVDGYEPELFEKKDKEQIKLINKYKEVLKEVDNVFVFYPTWWSSGPAHLEAFYEHVLTEGDFFSLEQGVIQPLQKFERTYIFTSSFTPNPIAKFVLRSASRNKNAAIWRSMGSKKVFFNNIDKIASSAKRREKFLEMITRLAKGGFDA